MGWKGPPGRTERLSDAQYAEVLAKAARADELEAVLQSVRAGADEVEAWFVDAASYIKELEARLEETLARREEVEALLAQSALRIQELEEKLKQALERADETVETQAGLPPDISRMVVLSGRAARLADLEARLLEASVQTGALEDLNASLHDAFAMTTEVSEIATRLREELEEPPPGVGKVRKLGEKLRDAEVIAIELLKALDHMHHHETHVLEKKLTRLRHEAAARGAKLLDALEKGPHYYRT